MNSFVERQIARLLREKYDGAESEGFRADSARLEKGEPYEYVLGYVDFCGARIDLSYRPMIPRPETAFWVARAIEELKAHDGPLRIADTFSGAGNVGVALLKHLPNARVEFFELDPGLIPQIEKNIILNGIDPARTKVVAASDIQGLSQQIEPADLSAIRGEKRKPGASQDFEHECVKSLPYPVRYSEAYDQDVHHGTVRGVHERSNKEVHQVCGLYDAIFAVPPYVPYTALPDLDPEMINFEPHLAFFAHEEGHEFHRILIEQGRDFLADGGTLYMETDMDHGDWVRDMVEKNG